VDNSNVISSVKQQYEELPYPPRNPEDEKKRLLRTIGDSLGELNHCCFKGRRDFNQDFRCLVAGGGTGDSVIYLAEQLRDTTAKIVYLDISGASRRIAEDRAAVRGLTNITWMTESLLSLPKLAIGKFDYINCAGVLHHLHDPEDGLHALNSVLKDDGCIFLLLYAVYGRQAIYLMQTLLREMIPQDISIPEKVAMARRIIAALPNYHAFKDPDKWTNEISANGYGDSGLYDLLLHSVDRCYDVNEVYALAATANLNVVNFLGPDSRYYNPDNLVDDPTIKSLWGEKSVQEQHSIAEKLFSHQIKHQFYLSRKDSCTASINDEENVFILAHELANKHMEIYRVIKPGEQLCLNYTINNQKLIFQLMGNKVNKACFKYLDGKTPISSIIRKVKIKLGVSEQNVRMELKSIFDFLYPMSWVYLQRP
jgi:ubiquinone/menaquinone biosynthesis C-methylase UbiE